MSDYDLPDLPSDEELGITDADRELLEEMGGDSPEMSDAEMRSLLGGSPPKQQAADAAKPDAKAVKKAEEKAEKKARRAKKKAEKEEARRRKKAEKAAAAAAKKESASRGEPSAGDENGRTGAESGPPGDGAAAGGAAGATPPTDEDEDELAGAGGRRWRGVVTFGALVAMTVFASSRTGLPRPVPANAPDSSFSSSRAMGSLTEIASEAHPPGSPEHARVRGFLVDRLRSLGLDPEIQTATAKIERGSFARTATVRNVVARIPGTSSTGAVLMTAHYDSRELSFGAGDDGVGVVTILETIRALQTGEGLRNDVVVLLTDGEELGLLGARAFVDEHPWMSDVRLVLSFEMRGSAGPAIMFETKDQNGWVVRAFGEFDPHPFANSMAYEVYQRMPNDTDFTPFKEAGVQGLNFAAIDNAHVYHQEYDAPQNVSESTLQHHGLHALAAARYFGAADLTSVDAPNVVYFTVPGLGLVVYDRWVVYALSGGLVLLLAAALFLGRRRGSRWSGMGLGALVGLVGTALAFGSAYALLGWVPRFHPEAGSLHGSTYHAEGWYVIALAAMTLAVVSGIHGIARRWLTIHELSIGALVLPFVLAIVVGFVAPLAAMNLQWPVVAALASVVVVSLLGDRTHQLIGWLAALLLAVPVLLLLVPVTELVWMALTLELGTALAVLIAMTLYLLLPTIEGLSDPNRWWAPLAAMALAGVAVGMGVLGSRSNGIRPAPSTLVYAYEHGTGAAIWVTDADADSLDSEAIAWAEERAEGPFEGLRDMSGFGFPAGQAPTAPAPVVSAQPPEVVVAYDSISAGSRYVGLRVRSRIGAEYLAFAFDGRSSTRIDAMNGREMGNAAELEWLDHWGEPDPYVDLDLRMPEGEAIGLHVVEHLLRPEELLGVDAFRRPPHLAPDITRLSDRAVFRYSVGAFADPRHSILPPRAGPELPAGDGAPVEPADSLASAGDSVRPDTAGGAVPDTSNAAPDTSSAAPDSSGAVPDTSNAAPDTSSAAPDTSNAAPDSSSTLPDTTGAAPDTSGAVPDTSGAVPDTSGAVPDTSRAAPDGLDAMLPPDSRPPAMIPRGEDLPDTVTVDAMPRDTMAASAPRSR